MFLSWIFTLFNSLPRPLPASPSHPSHPSLPLGHPSIPISDIPSLASLPKKAIFTSTKTCENSKKIFQWRNQLKRLLKINAKLDVSELISFLRQVLKEYHEENHFDSIDEDLKLIWCVEQVEFILLASLGGYLGKILSASLGIPIDRQYKKTSTHPFFNHL